ncbi:MAG TPA: sialidase family protein, partial [Rubricoccaceae bacterium]
LVLYAVNVDVPGRRFPASDLFLARSTDAGRTFGAPARVSPDGGVPTGHTFADVAVGPDGAVVVSWLDGTAQDAWQAARPAPSEAGGVHGDSAGQPDPHHEASAHGGMMHSSEGPGTTLVVARSEDGRTFGAPVAVAGGVCPCCRTALDIAPDGAVRVVWRHVWPGGERDPAIATSRDGGRTFGAPVRVHEDKWAIDGCPHAGPSVAAGADGRVHVAWYTGAEGRAGLWHAVSDDGGETFADPTALGAGAALGQTRTARDGQGRVWLAWESRGDSRVHLTAASGGDTTTVAGIDPALAGGAAGWTLAVVDDGAVRLHSRLADPAQ